MRLTSALGVIALLGSTAVAVTSTFDTSIVASSSLSAPVEHESDGIDDGIDHGPVVSLKDLQIMNFPADERSQTGDNTSVIEARQGRQYTGVVHPRWLPNRRPPFERIVINGIAYLFQAWIDHTNAINVVFDLLHPHDPYPVVGMVNVQQDLGIYPSQFAPRAVHRSQDLYCEIEPADDWKFFWNT
ncbi:hypothetical protein FOQG_18499 [Fusarium oxysporum f. sp. raphani 54005]|uniref:Uncharacterized protein n=2 Tax=Fusarium oxysporum f. sp. raphani TaxID=96318 RepID=X0B4V5_FUSOX|nr:hypothetical protein FOQG_18499 [Fusarium oxysporum f. sp. raphani 54005]KAG7405806.1 hypothetical protein Forpi1262_v018338 [Fusarium oxysporum f. sp. raphani]